MESEVKETKPEHKPRAVLVIRFAKAMTHKECAAYAQKINEHTTLQEDYNVFMLTGTKEEIQFEMYSPYKDLEEVTLEELKKKVNALLLDAPEGLHVAEDSKEE